MAAASGGPVGQGVIPVAMTITVYRVNLATGERTEVSRTRVAPDKDGSMPNSPLDFPPCSCPRCRAKRR